MSIKDNTALVIRYVQEVLNKGRIDSIDLICAPDLIIHLPQFLGALCGREVLKQLINYNRTVFPDGHVDIEDTIAERDKVSARGTFHGTYHMVRHWNAGSQME